MRLRPATCLLSLAALAVGASACTDGRLYDERGQSTGYRTGTEEDGYLSNGERGNVEISEILWAGSVETVGDGYVHHPDDVFIELRNKHSRPIHLTGWQIMIDSGDGSVGGADERFATYIIPERANGQPVEVNEYVVVAARTDGAFRDADYVIPNLQIPRDHFEVTIRDLDNRLIGNAGDAETDVFAGAWDLVTARSMERVQLIFSNQGGRNASWHHYSLNEWDGTAHQELRTQIAEAYRDRTYATPGMPNSPDYSGNTSAGGFE